MESCLYCANVHRHGGETASVFRLIVPSIVLHVGAVSRRRHDGYDSQDIGRVSRYRGGRIPTRPQALTSDMGNSRELWVETGLVPQRARKASVAKDRSGQAGGSHKVEQRILDASELQVVVCYISGKELVDHRTQVQTMYAPAGDVEVYTLGHAVDSYESTGEKKPQGDNKACP